MDMLIPVIMMSVFINLILTMVFRDQVEYAIAVNTTRKERSATPVLLRTIRILVYHWMTQIFARNVIANPMVQLMEVNVILEQMSLKG